ncbi:FliO/MopB family protein [Oceanibacterium hippocampi]|uniref:Flagellar biosynthesis protein FliO n=1 Tax=Oceanibacterium hippocampi TaxID=745714 RepID=A0A1Y5TZK5_9PROT|nr:flagellar biosynthetic protein FliO [Oceanibacterium hippocampi]SLN76809.1 flagellar biosynthesis protein FliO [Oceanibacterium hippocampi]
MEAISLIQYFVALVVVLGLIGLLAWAGKRFGMAPRISRPGGVRRLSVVDVTTIDAKRRLILVQRDDVQHLLLIGGENDLVVESGIARAEPARIREIAS